MSVSPVTGRLPSGLQNRMCWSSLITGLFVNKSGRVWLRTLTYIWGTSLHSACWLPHLDPLGFFFKYKKLKPGQTEQRGLLAQSWRKPLGPASPFQVPSIVTHPEGAPNFLVLTAPQSGLQGFFMRLKSNPSPGPTLSKRKLTGAEAPQAQSQ